MGEVSSVFQTKRIGVESTPGTAVAANKLLQSIGFTATVKPEIEDFTPDGSKSTALTQYVRDTTDIKVSGKPTYDELVYPFLMLFGAGTTTNPAGSAYKRVWYMKNRTADPIQTMTLDFGYDQYWYRAPYMFLNELSIKVGNKGVELDGSGMARGLDMTPAASSTSASYTVSVGAASGGTFTLTKGSTTSGIAYNASASVVQAALEALPAVGAGNVAVTGSGPWTISFINGLADQPVTLTGSGASLTGGAFSLSSVTTGVVPTLLPLVPVLFTQCDLYLTDTFGALAAATPLQRGFNFEFNLSDKADIITPILSSNTSFPAHVEKKPKVGAKLTLAADNIGRSMLTTMRGNGTKYLRLKALGPVISGAERYMFQITTALNVMDLSGPEDEDGIFALNWDFAVINDSNMESGFEIVLENTVQTP